MGLSSLFLLLLPSSSYFLPPSPRLCLRLFNVFPYALLAGNLTLLPISSCFLYPLPSPPVPLIFCFCGFHSQSFPVYPISGLRFNSLLYFHLRGDVPHCILSAFPPSLLLLPLLFSHSFFYSCFPLSIVILLSRVLSPFS